MLGTPSSVSSMILSTPYSSTAVHSTVAAAKAPKCDSTSFSSRSGESDSSFMNLVSRISQEVRTTTTTADIRELRASVQSGQYTPNPDAIAGKMLFFSED